MEQRHRKQAHAREMFAVIEKYLTSALSQQAPTPVHTTTNETPADFIPLRFTPAEPAVQSSTCAIEFPSGIVVRFQGPVDPSVLAQLIRAEQAEP